MCLLLKDLPCSHAFHHALVLIGVCVHPQGNATRVVVCVDVLTGSVASGCAGAPPLSSHPCITPCNGTDAAVRLPAVALAACVAVCDCVAVIVYL